MADQRLKTERLTVRFVSVRWGGLNLTVNESSTQIQQLR